MPSASHSGRHATWNWWFPFGLLVSYLPQHYRIISRGTAEGISPYFVLLGTTSATSGFANILTVPQSRDAIECCRELETFQCAAAMLGVAQLGMQWMCFALILVLFLIFFRYRDANISSDELRGESPRWQTAMGVGLACLAHGLVVVILTGVFTIALPNHLTAWANFLGVMAAALAAVQYFPQIWTTYHLKHVGSLSIPMMFLQTPGGLLFAASLYARLGAEGWSTWAVYLLTALMQGCVLFLAVYYEWAARREQRQLSSVDADGLASSSSLRRPSVPRTYSEGWERGLPGPFTGHPERYAETEDDLDDIQEREERAIARENQPLLRPGGIGNPRKNYRSTKGR
ncbi:PQ loop repeat protein [Moelleriella libera RCEF 2490]|uniref:PQ loop repeat protein n=1 Tax=Moelleriella libera RCEF 2490 TaxID=1081109 RepID=A0A167X4Z4_9HYPO|nr:PQ loop repeat protein [Moelleriella libera RCEF 2490]